MDAVLNRIANYLQAQSWQIAVLVVIVATVSWLLRRRSAHVRYLLWLVVLAKCLVPPVMSVPVAVLPEPTVQTEAPALLPPFAELPVVRRPRAAPTIETQSSPALPAAIPARRSLDLRQWLVLAWLAGVAAFVLIAAVKIARTVSWLRRERKPLSSELRIEIGALLSSQSRMLPRMWLMEGMGQPFVWGFLRGHIYLPLSFLALGDDEHRRNVLSHALCHIRRFDAAVNALQIAAQALFWFHPLIWWANRKTRQEREKACDEMAIARLGARPKDYSAALVNTLIQAQESTRPVPSLAVAGSVKNIEERIRAMLRPGKKFYRRPSLIAATIVLLAAILTVPTALVLTARAQTEPSRARTDSAQTLHQAAAAGDLGQVQKLLAQGADVHAKDEDGGTPLHAAAWYGRTDVAAVLLAHGANINEANGSGQTPLHLAANFGQTHMPELLLAQGAQIDARDNAGNTPLHAAADRPEVVKELLDLLIAKGADVNARNEAGQTPLHRVSMIGRLDKRLQLAAEVLLAHGAEVDAKDPNGCTPLYFAVQTGHEELVDLLVAKGADVKTKAADGTTLLHQAVKSGQLAMVEQFLNSGIDVNGVGSDGRTALHIAARTGENSIVETLIAHGADVKARDAHGETPAQIAVGRNRKGTVRLLLGKGAEVSTIQMAAYVGALDAVKGFLERGGSVNAQDGEPLLSPLRAAALGGQKEIAAFLISQGASVNAQNQNGATALHLAAAGGSKEVAELLIANGAEVDAKMQGGSTPLSMAASWGAKDVVLLLIDHGADVNAEAAGTRRPLDDAMRNDYRDIAKLLIDKGADTSRPDVLLFQACMQGDKDLVELLIQKGANVNSQAWGYAPAMQAMWSGDTNATNPAGVSKLLGVLEVLFDHGADPDAKDRWDWTLLHYGCEQFDLAKLLLDKGANPNAVENERGRRPLHFAADAGCAAAVELLISRGANVNAKDFYGRTALWYAQDLGATNMFGRPRKTPLTAEAIAAKREVAQILREHGAQG